MGCNMDCAFCWSYRTRIHPERFGDFYTPEEVAERLVKIAYAHDFRAVRISGNEYESLRIYSHIRKRMKERGLLSAQNSTEF